VVKRTTEFEFEEEKETEDLKSLDVEGRIILKQIFGT
jgi:hypothetical protein